MRPNFAGFVGPSITRAQGMPDAGRVRSRTCRVVNTCVSHHGHAGNVRHSPRDGVNGLYARSPRRPGFLAAVIRENDFANLMPASGHQDHTSLPSALVPFVKGTTRVHRIPPPTSVTIAIRPSSGTGWRQYVK